MTRREQMRAVVIGRELAGELNVGEALAQLGLSERQLRRLLRAYRAEGPAALVHGNRGRQPARKLTPVQGAAIK